MPVPTFRPAREADLLRWSANFAARTSADPAAVGLTADQAAAFAVLHDAFEHAYRLATRPETNSKANIIAKNRAKQDLLYGPGGARALVNIVQACPAVTNDVRAQLALAIPDAEPTPVPRPDIAPDLSIVSTIGRRVRIRLHDQMSPDRCGRPVGVQGAVIVHFAGEAPPADPAQWTFNRLTSKMAFEVDLPATLPPGERVWLSAMWFNARKECGPAATPESTRIIDGVAKAA